MQIMADRSVLPLQGVREGSLNLRPRRQHTGIEHLRLPMRSNVNREARGLAVASAQTHRHPENAKIGENPCSFFFPVEI